MAKYRVYCYWEMSAAVDVEAISEQDAIDHVTDLEFGLPEGDYVDGSFEAVHASKKRGGN